MNDTHNQGYWTPDLNTLLRKWKNQIGKRQKGHITLSRSYNKKHYIIGIPALLTSALIATGILSTFRNCDPSSQGSGGCEWIRLTLGVVGYCSTALSTFQTFTNYQSQSEQHKIAADYFESLYGEIDTLLRTPVDIRGDSIVTLQHIRSRYDDILKRTPSLPKEYDIDLTCNIVDSLSRCSPSLGGATPQYPTPNLFESIDKNNVENNVNIGRDENTVV